MEKANTNLSSPAGGGGSHDDDAKLKKQRLMPGRVRVLVRCRPLISTEEGHAATRLHVMDKNSIVINDGLENGDARQFTFDRVLPPETDQAEMFEEVAPLVEHVLNGFHGTVFAYGQTGSGKTHTMEGLSYHARRKGAMIPDFNTPAEQHGILLRIIQLLFDRARERQRAPNDEDEDNDAENEKASDEQRIEYSFRCSYYQIYNEVISDLLRPTVPNKKKEKAMKHAPTTSAGLRLRWRQGDSFQVENLFQCECDTAEKMRAAVFSGVKEKVVGSHLMNHQSSRSHCVFTIHVEARQSQSGNVVSRSELSLVDLAGSEKIGMLSNDPSAKLFKESVEINTSLLALGKVITALATTSRTSKRKGNHASGHVPYRDSKLTMLLKHALGGNSVTMMLACVSPSDRYVDESMSTLLYAGRARNIENVPQVNADPTTSLINRLRAEIAQLKEELNYYRALADGIVPQQQQLKNASGEVAVVQPGGAAAGSPSSLQSEEHLADSLISACGMLQHVLAMNGKLRDSYDILRESVEAAERRELALNAENLALRERIEMLESIALNPDFDSAADTDKKPRGGLQRPRDEGLEEEDERACDDEEVESKRRDREKPKRKQRSVSTPNRVRTEASMDASASRLESEQPAVVSQRQQRPVSREKRPASREKKLRNAVKREIVSDLILAPPPLPPTPPSMEPAEEAQPRALRGRHGRRGEEEEEELFTPGKPPKRAWGEEEDSNRTSSRGKSKGSRAARSHHTLPTTQQQEDSTELLGSYRPDNRQAGSSSREPQSAKMPSPAPRDLEEPRRGGQDDGNSSPPPPRKRRKHKKEKSSVSGSQNAYAAAASQQITAKKKKTLSKRLAEYEKKYRSPGTVETYADYYQQASTTKRVLNTTMGAKITESVKEMNVVLKKVSPEFANDFVPTSLKQPGKFGALSFSGEREDKAVFEAKRNDRHARLAALLEKQNQLRSSVQNDIREKRYEEDAGQDEANAPSSDQLRQQQQQQSPLFASYSGSSQRQQPLDAMKATAPYTSSDERQQQQPQRQSMDRLMQYLGNEPKRSSR